MKYIFFIVSLIFLINVSSLEIVDSIYFDTPNYLGIDYRYSFYLVTDTSFVFYPYCLNPVSYPCPYESPWYVRWNHEGLFSKFLYDTMYSDRAVLQLKTDSFLYLYVLDGHDDYEDSIGNFCDSSFCQLFKTDFRLNIVDSLTKKIPPIILDSIDEYSYWEEFPPLINCIYFDEDTLKVWYYSRYSGSYYEGCTFIQKFSLEKDTQYETDTIFNMQPIEYLGEANNKLICLSSFLDSLFLFNKKGNKMYSIPFSFRWYSKFIVEDTFLYIFSYDTLAAYFMQYKVSNIAITKIQEKELNNISSYIRNMKCPFTIENDDMFFFYKKKKAFIVFDKFNYFFKIDSFSNDIYLGNLGSYYDLFLPETGIDSSFFFYCFGGFSPERISFMPQLIYKISLEEETKTQETSFLDSIKPLKTNIQVNNSFFKLYIDSPNYYSIILYDVSGRIQKVFNEGYLDKGEYVYFFNSIKKGVYFLKMNNALDFSTKVFIII